MKPWYIKAKAALAALPYGQRGTVLAQIATECGVNVPAVYKWLAGDREPGVEDVKKIAKAVGMSFAELVEEDPYFVTGQTNRRIWDVIKDLSEIVCACIMSSHSV